ncbi:hypothetical protein [Armatimonas sp.]|uniref:hypothetical protein n=1 Tax=Armatimonas sp. TaxID=1872638 RepID=UPI00374DEA1C
MKKEPWLSNIAWGKFAGFLTFVVLILNQLNTAPVPASWHPWLMFAGALLATVAGFIINPKTKGWVPDVIEVTEQAPDPKAQRAAQLRAELAALEGAAS